MRILESILPLVTFILSFIFAFFIFRRFIVRRGNHLLLWGTGMLLYGIGGLCEAYYGFFGWSDLIYRLWYLCGAVLVAAWLGQGTVYLLAKKSLAHVLMVILALGSIYAIFRVFTAQLEPGLLIVGEIGNIILSGSAIVTPGVRLLTPFFNSYGTVTLVGGALWSAWVFWRQRILLHRAIGNTLIATGALFPAIGGTFSRLGYSSALYALEMLGALFMFIGFIRTTTPMKNVTSKTK
jgi:hypothetical protein